ncbi:MAG: tetratricopeptide repeat protein [Anaerolineae bacterium]|nr:tetratricopeptide repeat protein [Anaerolineae bacterium]
MVNSSVSPNAAALFKNATEAYNTSQFEQAVEHCRAVLSALANVKKAPESVLFDKVYERMVIAYQRLGDLVSAQAVVDEWLAQTGRDEGRILAIIQHCRVKDFAGDYEDATRLADEAIVLAETAGYGQGLGFAKRARADILWKLGHTDDALIYAESALELLEQAEDLEQQSAAHVSLSIIHHIKGHFYKAIYHLQQSIQLMEQLGQQYELAITYNNLGENYAQLYAMDKALEAHQRALDLVGIESAHPDLIRNLGMDLIGVGREVEGREYLALALERGRHDPDLIAQTLYSLADVNIQAGLLDEAEQQGRELLMIANKRDSLRHRIRALMVLGEIASRQGDYLTAQAHFHDSSMLAQRSANNQAIWRTHAALHKLMHDTMPQMAEIHRRTAAEMITNIMHSIEDDDLRMCFQQADIVRLVLEVD